MRFVSVVGARPQFIKVAMVSKMLRQSHEEQIIHTGQHYDYCLSEQFFQELAIPAPDYHLACGSTSHGAQTGAMLTAIEQVLLKEHFDWVLVYGDTNSTLAAALAAAKLHIPVAHIEAGLRSYNRAMPEEINRVLTDHLADRNFCPTEMARQCLEREGITRGVSVVGDVMYDMLLSVQPLLAERAAQLLPRLHVEPGNYLLATVHRAANTDDPRTFHSIVHSFNKLKYPIIFPAHPRARACIARYNVAFKKHVLVIDPPGYIDMLALQRSAFRILTDSGGIQKEAFFLGVPCITLRSETEWRETVVAGWNTLAGIHWRQIIEAVARPAPAPVEKKLFGEGDAALRIAGSW
ncbi:MAG TPA: UDP-N-acetylglucosamine 2-epimerase (non-hydrolyzing) [Ktedonobacteraceae bacterium]